MTDLKSKLPTLALALVVIVASGAVGVHYMTGSASADATGTTYASTTHLENSSASGQVDQLIVSSTGIVQWEDMPDGVESVKVELSTNSGPDKEYQTFASKTYAVDGDSSGEFSYGDGAGNETSGDVLAGTDWDSETFSADEEGETNKAYFPVKVTVTVIGPDGTECTFTETHKVKTSVTNLTDPGASGNSTIGGNIVMNDSNEADGHECVTC